MSSTGGPWRRALLVLPFTAIALGGAAEKVRFAGVERALLEALSAALILALLERVVRPRLGLERSPAATLTALGLAALGFLAVFVYPLPRLPARALVALELAALAADRLAARPPSPALVRRALIAAAALAALFALATHAVATAAPPDYDPSLYLLNGRWLLEGLAPYRDQHLSKAPVILAPNALYALAHDARFSPQAGSLLCALATGAILARAKALAQDPLRWLVFAVAAGLLSLDDYRQGGDYPETFAAPLLALAWATLMAEGPRGRDLVLGGAALALLGLTKQTHALYSLALLGVFALAERSRPRRIALVLAASFVTTGLVLAPFAAAGLLPAFFRATVLYWLKAPPILPTQGTLAERLVSLTSPLAAFALLAAAAAACVARAWLAGRAPARPVLGFLALLATASALQAIEQRVFKNPHYMLHLFLAFALAPWVLARTIDRPSRPARALLVLLAVWALVPFARAAAALPGALAASRERRAALDAFAARIDAAAPDPRAPLLVLGGSPQLYLLSRRPCKDARLFTALLLAQEAAQGPDGAARVRTLLRARPLVLVLVEPSNELDLLERELPGWRAEVADLSPLRPR